MASLLHQDAELMPGPAQRVKRSGNATGCNCSLDLIPALETPYATWQPKKRIKKWPKKEKENQEFQLCKPQLRQAQSTPYLIPEHHF